MVYQICEEISEKKYFTQFCNIIFHLNLSCYEIAVYLAIKRTAGHDGYCSKGLRRLAEECGLSKSQASLTIKKLEKAREELSGKSLIKVVQKTKKDGGENIITVSNIMPENIAFFEKKKPVSKIKNDNQKSKKVSTTRTPCPLDGQLLPVEVSIPWTKEELNIKKNQKKDKNSPSLLLSKYLFEKITLINPKHKQPNFNEWNTHIELMLNQDNRTEDEIKTLIDWIFKSDDPFWSLNILNTEKLRKQYDKIYIQMIKAKPKNNSIIPSEDKRKIELIQTNKQLAEFLQKKHANSPTLKITTSENKIQISYKVNNNNHGFALGFLEHGFKEQINSFLNKVDFLG